jgi:arginine deiminase
VVMSARLAAKHAIHGGEGWMPRVGSLRDEGGSVWATCGAGSEYGRLRSVLLHRPGPEVERVDDVAGALWVEALDAARAREQHDALAELYRVHGVAVHYVEDWSYAYPNLYFVRDSYAMTPEGAILARPASRVRAGEERVLARTLAQLGIPIVLTVHGSGTFEGGDLLLVNPDLALIGVGLRTNPAGVRQVTQLLQGVGVSEVQPVPVPEDSIHLDCAYSIVGPNLALCNERHYAPEAADALRRHGVRLLTVPDCEENALGLAINVVALAPGVVVMPAGCPTTRRLLHTAGAECIEIAIDELMKGGGAVHCVTGVLEREG